MGFTVEKALGAWRREGLRGLLRSAKRRVLRRRVMIFYTRDLDHPDAVPFMPRQCVVMRFGDESDLHLVAPHVPAEKLELYHRRLARGMRLGLVLKSDERDLLGWFWTTDRTFYEDYDHTTYRTQPGEIYHFDGQVVSGHRGRGVGFTAFPLIWVFWRSRGFRRAMCTIDATNRTSLKFHERMRYEPRGKLTIHSFLGFRWSVSTDPHMGSGDETDGS
jgi:predicted GNAT superfamily acetyltransferase